MKQFYLRHIFLCLCLLAGTNVFAYEALINGIYYNLSGYEAEVARSDTYPGDIAIPPIVTFLGQTYKVTSIGGEAFRDCYGLTSITIPNSVTSIGDAAFYCCTSLTSITIPNSVTSIGDAAFSYCSGLTSIKVAAGNTSYDSHGNCNAIIETATNTLIAGCKNTTIPNSVTSIGEWAFSGCSSLTSITIPNSMTYIGSYAFSDCRSLTSITIPNSVTSIGVSAFCGCDTLTSVTIGNGVASIGDGAFADCSSLTTVEMERKTPVAISENTFSNRHNAILYVPQGSKGIYASTSYWKEFKEIKEVITEVEIDGIYYNIDKKNMVAEVIPFPEKDQYSGDIIIPSSIIYNGKTYLVTSIGPNAFEECSSLTSITIPNSVTSIGDWAFEECSSLTFVKISDNLTSIERGVFYGCSSLTSVTIPNSVTSIGDLAFSDCISLASIIIPNNVTSIEEEAFMDCSGLTSVTIGNSVTSIKEEAFYGCSNLTSVTIPESVTNIGVRAFYYCNSLTTVEMEPKTPVAISEGTFSNRNNAILFVPIGSVAAYKAAPYWNEFKEIKRSATDFAKMDNVIYLEGAEAIADGGMATLRVKMKNSVDAAGFDFDMYLPEGCHFALDEDEEPDTELSRERFSLSEINNRRFFKRKLNEDGSLNAYAVYDTDKTIAGNDGTIVLVRIIVDEGVSIGGHPIVLKNWGVTDYFGSVLPKPINDPVVYPLDIIDMKRGDANGDEGPRINTGDFRTVTNYILGLPIGNLDETCADANGDGVIDVGDLTAMSNLLNYGTIYRPQK